MEVSSNSQQSVSSSEDSFVRLFGSNLLVVDAENVNLELLQRLKNQMDESPQIMEMTLR